MIQEKLAREEQAGPSIEMEGGEEEGEESDEEERGDVDADTLKKNPSVIIQFFCCLLICSSIFKSVKNVCKCYILKQAKRSNSQVSNGATQILLCRPWGFFFNFIFRDTDALFYSQFCLRWTFQYKNVCDCSVIPRKQPLWSTRTAMELSTRIPVFVLIFASCPIIWPLMFVVLVFFAVHRVPWRNSIHFFTFTVQESRIKECVRAEDVQADKYKPKEVGL